MTRRLSMARELERDFAEHGIYRLRWERELPRMRAVYPNLQLGVQMGLLPIGPDPDSKLWEFWDIASGAEPLRDATGTLIIEEDSGLVFVLLRGGPFWMGAQSQDPQARNYDPEARGKEGPPHEITLSAFFLSKY